MEILIWILTAIGLGAGLAMDACAVSMSNGLAEPKMKINKILTIAGFFGAFQIIMPILGYLAVTVLSVALGERFTKVFGYLVPWIALTLLLILGIKMIVEGIKEGKNKDNGNEESTKKLTIKVLFIQAIATSIDALSLEELRSISDKFDEDIYDAISLKTCVEKRLTIGAPGEKMMKQVIEKNKEYLKNDAIEEYQQSLEDRLL